MGHFVSSEETAIFYEIAEVLCWGPSSFLFWWFWPARPGSRPGCWRLAVSWRLCRLETARTLWVLCRLGWGVSLEGETYFSFVGKREVFTLQLVFCLPGWGVPLAGKPPFHLPARRGFGPCRQAFTNLIIKIHQTIMVTHVRIVSGFLCNYRPKDKWLVISLLTAFSGIPPAPVGCPGRSGRG